MLDGCCKRQDTTKTKPKYDVALKKDHKLSHCADTDLTEDAERFSDR